MQVFIQIVAFSLELTGLAGQLSQKESGLRFSSRSSAGDTVN